MIPTHIDTEGWGRYLAQHYAKAPATEHAESCASDAPYSFWLGADTPRPDDFKASC